MLRGGMEWDGVEPEPRRCRWRVVGKTPKDHKVGGEKSGMRWSQDLRLGRQKDALERSLVEGGRSNWRGWW
jgi:hypothetical protein